MPDCMDLLKKMDNLSWEKTWNCIGFHMSLHMKDEKLKLNKENRKQIFGIRSKFEIHDIGCNVSVVPIFPCNVQERKLITLLPNHDNLSKLGQTGINGAKQCQTGWKRLNRATQDQIKPNRAKWSQTGSNGAKPGQMGQTGSNLAKPGQTGPNRPNRAKLGQTGPNWAKLGQTGPN